jgi:hypothetical protein
VIGVIGGVEQSVGEPDDSYWINAGRKLLTSLADGIDLPQAGRRLDSVPLQTLLSHGCARTSDDDPGGKGCCDVIPRGQRTRIWRGGFASE